MIREYRVKALIDNDNPGVQYREIVVEATSVWNAGNQAWDVLGPEHDKRKPRRDKHGRLYREPEIVEIVALNPLPRDVNPPGGLSR